MAYNPEEDIKVSDLPIKTTDAVNDDKLLIVDSQDNNILKQIDAGKVKGGGGTGTGDMLKSVYDTNNNGIVDNSEALGGFPASDYAKSADVQPTLESGVNIKTINGNSILGPGNIEIQGGTGTVDTEMSDTSTNAVQNKVIKAYVDSQSGGGGYQVFALTGSYGSDASQLNDTDYQTYLQAVEYLNNGGLALLSGMGDGYFYPYYNSGNMSGFIKSGYRDVDNSTGTIILYKGSSARVYIEKKVVARKGGFQQGNNICIDDIALTSGNRDYKFTMSNGASDIENYVMLFGIKINRKPSGSSSVYLEDEVAGMIVGEGIFGYKNFVVGNTFSSSYEYNNQTKYGRITVNPILSGGVGEKTIRFTLNKSISDADTKAYFNFILIST